MYRCEKCKKTTNPHTKQYKTITEKRAMEYKNRMEDKTVKISGGWEIIREISVCPGCFGEEIC